MQDTESPAEIDAPERAQDELDPDRPVRLWRLLVFVILITGALALVSALVDIVYLGWDR